jgi:phage shock protein A
MGLFGRMKVLWLGFWSGVIGSGEKNVALTAKGAIENHKQNLERVQNALTNLIFQRKKLDDKVSSLATELRELEQDLEQAAREDRDDLALVLISSVEKIKEEHDFLAKQSATLRVDIQQARDTESQLKREIIQAEQMLGSLTSRYEALKVRRNLQDQLSQIQSAVNSSTQKLEQPLTDHVHRLEAEIESSNQNVSEWSNELKEMRDSRHSTKHKEMLDRIKDRIHNNIKSAKLPTVVAEGASN